MWSESTVMGRDSSAPQAFSSKPGGIPGTAAVLSAALRDWSEGWGKGPSAGGRGGGQRLVNVHSAGRTDRSHPLFASGAEVAPEPTPRGGLVLPHAGQPVSARPRRHGAQHGYDVRQSGEGGEHLQAGAQHEALEDLGRRVFGGCSEGVSMEGRRREQVVSHTSALKLWMRTIPKVAIGTNSNGLWRRGGRRRDAAARGARQKSDAQQGAAGRSRAQQGAARCSKVQQGAAGRSKVQQEDGDGALAVPACSEAPRA